jgi:Family of unknown function (DUF5995)
MIEQAAAAWPSCMTGVAERVRRLDPDRTPEAVIERLQQIERELRGYRVRRLSARRRDGVAAFNYMYLCVTEEVVRQRDRFEAPAFLDRLAVVFSEFYFAAYDAAHADAWVSRAWAPVFEQRHEKGPAPIQFALAGLNAHINNDLAWALLQTWDEFAVAPREGSPEWRDFAAVSDCLERVQGEVRSTLESGLLRWLDRALGRFDDVVANVSIARARHEAWRRGARWRDVFDEEAAAAHERQVGYESHLILAA